MVIVCSSENTIDINALGNSSAPIVDGWLETGYLGVGLLYMDDGSGTNTMCTGTHIGSGWVLTAAHCVDGLSAVAVRFFDGTDVSRPSTGTWYNARSVHPHSGFVLATLENDIALVNFDGVDTLPVYMINRSSISAGLAINWVGYGVSSVSPDSGSGVKRSGTGDVDETYLTFYRYTVETDESEPCRGDSGGPSFATISGSERIVGLVSGGDEHCDSYGNDTRVDAYASWIDATIAGGTVPDCAITGGDCDEGACWPTSDGFICYPSSELSVGSDCDSDPLTWSNLPCEDGAICIPVSDDPHDGECMEFCESDTDCADGKYCHIPVFTDVDDIGICLDVPAGCDLLGGDCGTGEACFPTISGVNDCFPSDEIAAGESCNEDQSTWVNLPCEDGAICVGLFIGGGECLEFCYSDADCGAVELCQIPIFMDIDDVGVCVPCTDRDHDGYCINIDCDDLEETAYPGATERCGDGIDNDCDDDVDEDCEDCNDNDFDGYCDSDDCDDDNDQINPAATEICDDEVDNNCDEAVDEDDVACGAGGDGDADGDSDGDGDGDTGGGASEGSGCTIIAKSPAEHPVLASVLLVCLMGVLLYTSRRR